MGAGISRLLMGVGVRRARQRVRAHFGCRRHVLASTFRRAFAFVGVAFGRWQEASDRLLPVMDAAAAVAAAELADIKAALAERQEYRQVRHVPCQSPELAISACVTASELPAPRQ